MAITTTTQTADIIEKRVSEIVTETLIQNAVALGAVKDFTSQVGAGMDTLKVPLYAEMAVQDVLEAGAMTPQTLNVLTADLDLNRHKSIPFSISDKAGVQSKGALVQNALMNGSKSLSAEIDNHIFGLIDSSVAGANRFALTANPLEDIAKASKLLDDNNCPKVGRYLVISPAFKFALLKNSGIIDADKFGNSEPKQAGYVTRIYGFTVIESSSPAIVDGGFQAFGQDAIGFARQIAPKFESERNVLGQRWDYALTHLYGAMVLDPSGLRMVVADADGL